jgi:hypothetical protein
MSWHPNSNSVDLELVLSRRGGDRLFREVVERERQYETSRERDIIWRRIRRVKGKGV